MSSNIKRWDYDYLAGGTVEDAEGSYVLHSDHEAEVARLRAEVEKYRTDAERYRWLRGRSWRGNGAYFFTGPSFKHETNLGAAIDAAMGASA